MKKIIISLIITFMSLLFVTGCDNMPYNAKIYHADNWIKSDFANDNLIRNTYYFSDDSDEEFHTEGEEYPLSRTFIVESDEERDKIFIENKVHADFNNQIVIVHTFRATNHREINLVSVRMQDNVLKITFESPSKSKVIDTCMPYQRWIVIKLDKVEFASVEFIKNK